VADRSDIAETLELQGKRRKRRLPWGWIVAVLILTLIGFLGFQALRPAGPPGFVTAEVTRGDLDVTVTATGTLEPVDQVDVGVEVSGTVQQVLVDFNDRVTAGQPLAILDREQLQATVTEAEARLAQAEAEVAQARATAKEQRTQAERVRRLARQGNASDQQLEVAEAAVARAEAGVARARAAVQLAEGQLASARDRLEKAEVVSPIDGIVLDRLVEPGQTVAASFQTPHLFTLARDLAEMELKIDVDEADIGVVAEGQSAVFTVDAYPNRSFEARIESVRNAPRTQAGVVTYQAVLSVPNPDLLLKPGMTATAEVLVERAEDAILVPNGALRFTPPDLADPPEAPGPVDGQRRGIVWRPGAPVRETQSGSNAQGAEDVAGRGRVAGGAAAPEAVVLTLGLTDGRQTQVLAGDIAPGAAVITDVARTPRRGR
jgi:HlyD family secretion protein